MVTAQDTPKETGRIDLPYSFGDGGIIAMVAGRTVKVTWEDAPADAVIYVFVWKSLYQNKPWFIMGIDSNNKDNISIQWKVKEMLNGVPFGIAIYPDGRFSLSDISTLEYSSGQAPPEGICSASYSGGDGLFAFDNLPGSKEIHVLGELRGYAPVIEQVVDSESRHWLKIDLRVPNLLGRPDSAGALPEFGWIAADSVQLHGNCSLIDP